MQTPSGWQNPIAAKPGQIQLRVDPRQLLPSRTDLLRRRLDFQHSLLTSGIQRYTLIEATASGIPYDGHHGARAAAELGMFLDVQIVDDDVAPCGLWILDLPVR